MNNTHNVTSHR